MTIRQARRSRWSAALGCVPMMAVVAAANATALGAAPDSAATAAPSSQTDRVALANDILNRWEPIAVQAGAHSPAWREVFATQLTAMDPSILRRLDRIRADASDPTENYVNE